MLRDLLDSVPVQYQQSRSKKSEVTICCPFCEERGERADDRYRLGINVEQGMGHCFNCGWRSGSYSFTLRELCRIYGIRRRLRDDPRALRDELEKERDEPAPTITGYPQGYEKFTSSGDWFERKAREYLKWRGVTLEQIKKHKIGYAFSGPYAGRVLFPVMGRRGLIYGCVARSITTDVKPKYLNTPGIKMLWNAYLPTEAAVVSEGVMDALAIERAVNTSVITSIARLGSTITKLQLRQLSQFEEVIIFPDFDEVGVKGARELATTLHEGRQRVRLVLPKAMDDTDPGSKTHEEIARLIAGAVLWNKATEMRLRVAAAKFV